MTSARPDTSEASRRQIWSVGGLLQAVAEALAARWAVCTVEGELSSFTRAASGHCYFSLKDADGAGALVRCAMFRRAVSWLDFTPRDGQRVQVRGRLGVYEARGDLQLVVEAMQLAGAGSLHEQFLRLKAKLEGEGLFDAERKRPLPRHPRRLGVITSLGAAALHDVLTALARRSPHVEVIVYPALVQGADAPPTLIAALALANVRAEVDALILCRGGGSLEDLWAFNDEQVVRAVAGSVLPVVCGVGHESDVSLADFAADLRAPTPTAAAELAAPRAEESLAVLDGLQLRLTRRVHHRLEQQAQRLDAVSMRLARPGDALRQRGQRLALLAHRLQGSLPARLARDRVDTTVRAERLSRAMTTGLRQERQRLEALGARLASLDPHRVLRRGYAWLEDAQGHAVSTVSGLQVGDRLRAVLADGELRTTVDETTPVPEAGGTTPR